MKRLSWNDYFVNVVNAISERSTCDRGKPGCIFVKNNQVLVTGYAGSPPGFQHCDEAGHEMEERIRFINVHEDTKVIIREDYEWNEITMRWETKKSQHCIRTIHAEQNAIIQAAKRGISLEGSTCYVTMTPCRTCAMMLVGLGIKNVVAIKKYQKAKESIEIFNLANIQIVHLDEEKVTYEQVPETV